MRHHVLVEVRERQNGVELRQEGVERGEQGPRAAQEARRLRQVDRRAVDHRGELAEERLEVRPDVAEVAHGRAERVGHGLQVVDERVGVDREGRQAVERRARLVEEDREDVESRRQRVLLGGGGREGALRVDDQVVQLPVALVERGEDDAGVLHDALERVVLGVEDVQHARARLREVAQVAEREVEVLAGAAPDRLRRFRHPLAERGLGRVVERAQDLVELDRRLDLAVVEEGPIGQLARAPVPRRELHVGLAQQRLLAQDRARVPRDRGVLAVDVERHGRRDAALVELLRTDLAHGDARDPHVGLLRERRRLGEVDLQLVGLRLQRNRAAERQPEEQQQPEARQREDHHRQDPADARGLLLQLAPPSADREAGQLRYPGQARQGRETRDARHLRQVRDGRVGGRAVAARAAGVALVRARAGHDLRRP